MEFRANTTVPARELCWSPLESLGVPWSPLESLATTPDEFNYLSTPFHKNFVVVAEIHIYFIFI